MLERKSLLFSKYTLSLSALFVSSAFILIQILRFDTALWDHYGALSLYLHNYQSSDFSVLDSWIKGLTNTSFTYRPTYNLLLAIQYELMGTRFPYYYLFKWLLFMGAIILMARRLILLKVSSWAALFFSAIVLTHPASPLLMLFSGDLYIVVFACILFEVAVLFFRETRKWALIALGITGTLVSFLAGGTKEVAPVFMGLVILWAWLLAGNPKNSLFRALCLMSPLIPSSIGVLLTTMNAKSPPGREVDFILTFGEGFLGVLPVGTSFIIFLGCVLILCLYFWKTRKSSHPLRDPKLISCFFSLAIALTGLAVLSVALPTRAHTPHVIADRYLFPSMFFVTVGLVIACDALLKDLKPQALTYGKCIAAAAMLLVMFIGLSGQAYQMNSYLAYSSHIHHNLKSISSLTAAQEEVKISGNITRGELFYNIKQIFTHYHEKYNVTYYQPSVLESSAQTSEVVWGFSGHTFETFRAKSAIAEAIAGQRIEKIELADAPVDRLLWHLSKLYLRLFSYRQDVGAPYLIDWPYQPRLNHEFRIYKIKFGPGATLSYERQLEKTAGADDISEDNGVFSFEGHAAVFTTEFIRNSFEQVGIVIRGKITTDKPEAISFGLREKNGNDISGTMLNWSEPTESGEFMSYFDITRLKPTVPYEFFVFRTQDSGKVAIEKSVEFMPVTRF